MDESTGRVMRCKEWGGGCRAGRGNAPANGPRGSVMSRLILRPRRAYNPIQPQNVAIARNNHKEKVMDKCDVMY